MKRYLKNLTWYFLLLPIIILAQHPTSYSIRNGLPSNHVYDVLEDKSGFIWMATNRGLVKFDGYDFKVFTHKDGLPNNDVWKLRLDADSRLWFFSKSHLQGFVEQDSIHVFPTLDNKAITPNHIYAYPDGLTINLQQEKFTHWQLLKNPNYRELPPNKELHTGKKIFHIQYNHQYFIIDKNTASLFDENFNLLKEVKCKESITTYTSIIHYFPNETFSVKGRGNIFFVNAKTHQIKIFTYKDLGFNETQTVMVKQVGNEYQISGKNLLYIIDEKFNIKEKIELNYNVQQNFSMRDSKGNIWLWNTQNGVCLITKNQINTRYHLKGKKINVIGKIGNEIVAASETRKDFCFYFNGEEFQSHPYVKNNGKIFIPYHIVNQQEEDYLVCQNKIFSYKNGRWDFFDTYLYDYYEYGAKDILLHDGVHYFITSTFLSSEKKERVYTTGLTDLEEWNNQILIGSSNGLKILKNDSIQDFLPKDVSLNSPISRLVKGKNTLWIGTDGRGVFGLNKNKLHHIKATDDLSITEIIEDKNMLWISSNNGVRKIKIHPDISSSTIQDSFYESDGLLQNNVNCIHLNNNELWISTDVGISVISTNDFQYNLPTQLYFKHPNDTLKITHYENRSQSISFGAIDFSNQSHLSFYYRLSPGNKDWIQTQSRNINFNQLDAGNYVLDIKSENQHGKNGFAQMHIIVVPRWWETKWAMVVFIVGAILLLGLIFWIINHFAQKRKIKKIELERRTQGLELQALRSQMNPHFVHNSLNAIQYYIQLNDVDKSEYYLTKFSELIRLFFEYSREKDISIRKEIDLLKRYLDIEKLRFEDKIDYEIHVDENLDTDEHKIPTMILQPLVENAINHGLFHKKTEGKVDIYFDLLAQNSYRVQIVDDGIGMDKAKEIYQKSVKNYRSRSSMVLEERLKLLNKSKEWEIQYNVNSNSEGSNTGTHITITFKNLNL